MLFKCCTPYSSKFRKLISVHRNGKCHFSIQSQRGQCQRMLKLLHNCIISHVSKVMLKILQARLQQYVNLELPDVQVGFRKGRGRRDQIANICWIIKKKQESSRKSSTSPLLIILKPLTVWITINCGKFFKEGNTSNYIHLHNFQIYLKMKVTSF